MSATDFTSMTWTEIDDATWAAAAAFCLLYLGSLTIETICRFKRTLMWYVVVVAIPLNVAKMIIVMVYTGLLQKGDPLWRDVFRWYYIVNIFVYLTQHIALYQRKKVVRPDPYYLDEIVLVTLSIVSTVGNLPCLVGMNMCWAYSGNILLSTLVVSFLYFDIYYCYKIMVIYQGVTDVRKRILLMLPAYWTITQTFLYGLGTILYSYGASEFYTNWYWNMACLLFPIVAIQSNISTNVNTFVQESATTAVHTKASGQSKMVESKVSR
jgi:hypothetical protein